MKWRTLLGRYALALALIVAAALLRAASDPLLGHSVRYFPFYGAVMAAAVLAGLGPGLLATALGGICGSFFFSSIPGSLSPHSADDAARLSTFLLTGIFISIICEQLHRSVRRAADERDERVRADEALRESGRRYQEQLRLHPPLPYGG